MIRVLKYIGPHLQCDCCKKTNMKKLYRFSHPELEEVMLGAICIEKHFDVSMTGNPYGALRRINSKVNSLKYMEVEEIISSFVE